LALARGVVQLDTKSSRRTGSASGRRRRPNDHTGKQRTFPSDPRGNTRESRFHATVLSIRRRVFVDALSTRIRASQRTRRTRHDIPLSTGRASSGAADIGGDAHGSASRDRAGDLASVRARLTLP
jgi:hypothetical protein